MEFFYGLVDCALHPGEFMIRNVLIVLFCLLHCPSPSCASDWEEDSPSVKQGSVPLEQTTSNSISTPKLLKGGVRHSDNVGPIDSRFLPGKLYDANAQFDEPEIDDWVQIPEWLAGTFTIDSSLIVSAINCKSGRQEEKNRMEYCHQIKSFGHQLDENGNIWHLNKCPVSVDIATELTTQHNLAIVSEFPRSDNDLVQVFYSGPAVIVMNGSGVILRASQLEAFTSYHKGKSDVLKDISIKDFDVFGQPSKLIVRKERLSIVEPFAPDPKTERSFRLFQARRNGLR